MGSMGAMGNIGSKGIAKQKFSVVVKRIWKMAAPYWSQSEEKWGSIILLAVNVFMMVFNTAFVGVRMTEWNAEWMNAFTQKNPQLWMQQIWVFIVVGVSSTAANVFNAYISQWIALRWRRWMTARYLRLWMEDNNHYKMQLTGSETDNPDQRITEDITGFITNTWTYTFLFVQNLLSLFTYTVILWNLSASVPLVFGTTGGFDGHGDYSFPGHFIFIAIVWVLITTGVTHWLGKPMTRLTFDQQMYDANFRFSLVRFRENSEQIALLGGEPTEHTRLMKIFGDSIRNSFRIQGRTMKMGWGSAVLAYGDMLMFTILLGPAYFYYGAIPDYGTFTMITMSFMNVTNGLKWFQTYYTPLAQYIAIIERLYAFNDNYEKSKAIEKDSKLKISVDADELEIKDLDVFLPYGKKQISAEHIEFKQGDKVLIKGRTGAGKTTLFRVLSGIWPYATGSVRLPKDKRVIVLPQRPYFPIGSLEEAVSYPEPAGTYSREAIKQALVDVGMGQLTERLDEVSHWNMMLSGGEQQRIGVARAMLYKPDYVFFDEATASMDEPSEEELYTMLLQRMKDVTIISIGHRSSLQKFHTRLLFAESDNQPIPTYHFEEQDIAMAAKYFAEEELEIRS